MNNLIRFNNGNSGCHLVLSRDDKGLFVRKSTNSADYNTRLQAQCKKQNAFSDLLLSAPPVFRSGFSDLGLFYFDMQYVSGQTLGQFIRTVDAAAIPSIVEDLFGFLSREANQPLPPRIPPKKAFQDKISELSSHPIYSPSFLSGLNAVKTYDFTHVPCTKCHGDLIFENIIISNGRLYALDFLDSFFDSWVFDAAKLMQDSFTLWCLRGDTEVSPNALIRLLAFQTEFERRLLLLGKGVLELVFHILLLNLLRIYPYAKTPADVLFLDRAVDKVLEKGCL